MVQRARQAPGAGAHLTEPSPGRDILLVALPIVLLGVLGNWVGLATLLGGAVVNLGYVLAIGVGAVVLARQGTSWWELGLGRPEHPLRTLGLGVAAGVGAIVVFVVVQAAVIGSLTALDVPVPALDESRFNPIQGNLPLFVLMVGLAWTTIAFGEELFYRAFLVSRLVDHSGIGRWGAILLAGTVFGLVHFAEGPVGVASNGAFGVLFGWIYLRSGRNLWITIVGHGLINTLRFGLLYVGAV